MSDEIQMESLMSASSRLYPDRPFLATSVAVIRDQRVFLAQRTRPPSQALYTLPGGLVELGERLEEAALRELYEEVSMTARLIGIITATDIIDTEPGAAKTDVEQGKIQAPPIPRIRQHFCVVTFAAHWVCGEGSISAEAGDVKWVTLEEIDKLPVTPNLRNICERAFKIAAL